MWTEEYLAIWDERLGDYKWYVRPKSNADYSGTPANFETTTYFPTGRFVNRDYGMRAEIFEASDYCVICMILETLLPMFTMTSTQKKLGRMRQIFYES